jgi:hypothetical protein
MAIWYTDNINGNDTTGLGTIAAPYKTINKAMTVGANDDEIRVAGSTFTALSGTITATSNGSTTWNTSVNQTGILNPGDIITVNDAEFGDQKFFYKVFSVGATSIVVDGAWNRTANVQLTFSRIPVASQQYYTTTASQTFENINIAGKTQFIIRGGWINNFTEQTGWTAMNYHSTVSATAQSGTGFTATSAAPPSSGMYIDRFMFSHITSAILITQSWTPGTLAFVFGTTNNIYQGSIGINATYPTRDLYLTNSRFPSAGTSLTLTDGEIGNQWVNCWYSNTVNANSTNTIICKFTNVYSRSTGSSFTINGAIQSYNCVVNNLIAATQQNAGTTTETVAIFAPNGANNNYLNGTITIVGPNAASTKATFPNVASGFSQISIPTQIIEDIAGSTATQNSLISQTPSIPAGIRPISIVIDQEGEKQIYGAGQIVFADSSQFDTGTNSLRVSNTFPVGGTVAVTPINSYYNSTSVAKTITIRAKASAVTSATFSIISNRYNSNAGSAAFQNRSQVFSLTTDWQNYTYTGLDAGNAAVLLNSYLSIGLRVDNLAAKYVWIDSITIS